MIAVSNVDEAFFPLWTDFYPYLFFNDHLNSVVQFKGYLPLSYI